MSLNGNEREFNINVGEAIRMQRLKFRRTQAQVAAWLGIKQGTISKIEAGKLGLTAYQYEVLKRLNFKFRPEV
jgi:DNA-binding XRE family transcriptional regulator